MRLGLLYAASALTALWGVAHLFATNGVVRGFVPRRCSSSTLSKSPGRPWLTSNRADVEPGAFTTMPRGAMTGDNAREYVY
jgi:hypothetical protein